jgi:ComF family protein
MSNHIRWMLHYLINYLYPPRCAACDARMRLDSVARICQLCIGQIERIPDPICRVCGIPLQNASSRAVFDQSGTCGYEGTAVDKCRSCAESPPYFGQARAIARYRPGVAEDGQVVPSIIRRHKYGRDQSLSRALAQCLGENLPVDGNDYDLVLPVPLHRRRLRWRGFNQAALLGLAVARKIGCPLDVATLTRIRDTPAQTSQDSNQRRQNVRGVFAVRRPERIATRRLLLVDDVMTTGATLDECARTLLAAGAQKVDVLTLARAV